jgi:hypothetical protein
MKFTSVAVSTLVSSFFFASTTVPLVSAAPQTATTCSITEDDDGYCEDGKTLVCGSVKEKDGSIGFLQMCKKNGDIENVKIGRSLGGDKTLASCGCCTESTNADVLAALLSNSAKLKFAKSAKKSAKKYSKNSEKDDKTRCLDLSELICRKALRDFKLTASQDEDYGFVTLQTGHFGNHCTWSGGELEGTCPENNCIVRATSSIPHIKNVCVHDGAGTL